LAAKPLGLPVRLGHVPTARTGRGCISGSHILDLDPSPFRKVLDVVLHLAEKPMYLPGGQEVTRFRFGSGPAPGELLYSQHDDVVVLAGGYHARGKLAR